jgi:uncharacterized Fe-S cluster protein YjdI
MPTLARSLAAAALAALVLGAQAASADTQIFKDVLRPDGVARSQEQKFADGQACGATADNTFTDVAAFQTCMRGRGWVVDHIVPDPKPTWIDPDTGLECHRSGIADICVTPHGTVTYTNKHGIPCKRPGTVAICTNL